VERHQETYSSLKGDYAELWNASTFFVMSVRPRGTTWMPLNKLLWNIISEYIQTIWREKCRTFTILGAGISGWLRAGRSGDRSRCGEIFRTYLERPWGPRNLLYSGYRVFSGGKFGRGVTLTTHTHLVPRSWKSRAIHLLPLWAPVACYRVKPYITLSYLPLPLQSYKHTAYWT